ncbi:MAG: RNA polymerase sigma-70 factor [Tannerella sp.]|jgi:RNA polymerase sigma-70 factor (ECF subfamily)|nr:RNA polymerase sigma-70 factor [Tannerella sp.]
MIVDIEKIRQGDEAAFKVLYTSLFPKLTAWASRFVCEDDALDIVQDVFADFWEKRATLEVNDLKKFLSKWVRNNCLNYLKHRAVEKEYAARMLIEFARDEYQASLSDDNEVFNELVNKDLREKIEAALTKLPARCAEVVRLRIFHDLEHKDIAKKLKIKDRTVESHFRNAAIKLRDDLKDLLTIMLLIKIL